MEIVKKRMTRDEMCVQFRNKYLVLIDTEDGIGKLNIEAGKKSGFVLAVFEQRQGISESLLDMLNEIPDDGYMVLYTDDYTEEVFNLGTFIIAG